MARSDSTYVSNVGKMFDLFGKIAAAIDGSLCDVDDCIDEALSDTQMRKIKTMALVLSGRFKAIEEKEIDSEHTVLIMDGIIVEARIKGKRVLIGDPVMNIEVVDIPAGTPGRIIGFVETGDTNNPIQLAVVFMGMFTKNGRTPLVHPENVSLSRKRTGEKVVVKSTNNIRPASHPLISIYPLDMKGSNVILDVVPYQGEWCYELKLSNGATYLFADHHFY